MPISTARARIAGVIGWPVAHSRSPRLHNHWLARHGIDGAYVPLPASPGDLAAALGGLAALGFAGANVTLPHKEAAAALCDRLDDAAREIGAVNTLVVRDGRLHGSSTDGYGFLANLAQHGVAPGPALLLGAGGAARAVAAALAREAGVPVTVANRTESRARALAAALPGVRALAWEAREAALADHALLVNTTAAGMQGKPALPLSLDRAAPRLVVADIVYVPLETPLLAAARARGLVTVGGLGMLLHQARPGFAAWFGVDPAADRETFDLLAADIPPR